MTGPVIAPLTEVDLLWVEDRINHWLRFGRPRAERFIGRSRRVASFVPGTVFAYLRWQGNDYGTTGIGLAIVRAGCPGEAVSTLPGVRPGGAILLRLAGWPRVERALQAIDAVEALGLNAADAAPEHWAHVHNRLLAGQPPRPYSADQHRAWLRRRWIVP
jgi:hypothetical protein